MKIEHISFFRRSSHIRKIRLLPSSRQPICLQISVLLPVDEFPWNLILGTFIKNLLRKLKFPSNLEQISGTLHEGLSRFIVAGDTKLPSNCSLRVKMYGTVGTENVPQCYVSRKIANLIIIKIVLLNILIIII